MFADLSAAELDALGRPAKALDAAHAGHRLSLATPQEYADRVARVGAQRADAAERAKAEHDEHTRGSSAFDAPDASTITRVTPFGAERVV